MITINIRINPRNRNNFILPNRVVTFVTLLMPSSVRYCYCESDKINSRSSLTVIIATGLLQYKMFRGLIVRNNGHARTVVMLVKFSIDHYSFSITFSIRSTPLLGFWGRTPSLVYYENQVHLTITILSVSKYFPKSSGT